MTPHSGSVKSAWSHHQQGADEKEQETPKEERVKDPAVLDPQHLYLAEYLGKEPFDPLGQTIEAVERFALTPDPQPPPEPPGHDGEGGKGQNIHRQDDPMTDVPVDFAGCFHSEYSSIKVSRYYESNIFEITSRWTSFVPS